MFLNCSVQLLWQHPLPTLASLEYMVETWGRKNRQHTLCSVCRGCLNSQWWKRHRDNILCKFLSHLPKAEGESLFVGLMQVKLQLMPDWNTCLFVFTFFIMWPLTLFPEHPTGCNWDWKKSSIPGRAPPPGESGKWTTEHRHHPAAPAWGWDAASTTARPFVFDTKYDVSESSRVSVCLIPLLVPYLLPVYVPTGW